MLSALSDAVERGGVTRRSAADEDPATDTAVVTEGDQTPRDVDTDINGDNQGEEISGGAESTDSDRSDQSDSTDSGDNTDAESADLSLDSIFFALSNSRRRGVVYCLKEIEGQVDVSRLTTLVAAMENGIKPEEVVYDQRKRVYTSLYQSHLPKMDDMGIVAFDQRAGTVEPANGLREIDVYLEIVPRSEISWCGFYFGIGALSLTASLLGWLAIYPFGLVPSVAYAGAFAIVLMLSSVVHRVTTRTRASEDDLDTGVLQELPNNE